MKITYGFGGKVAFLHINGKEVSLGDVKDKADAESRARKYLWTLRNK